MWGFLNVLTLKMKTVRSFETSVTAYLKRFLKIHNIWMFKPPTVDGVNDELEGIRKDTVTTQSRYCSCSRLQWLRKTVPTLRPTCDTRPSRLIGSVPFLLATRTASFELAPDNRHSTSIQPANTSGPWWTKFLVSQAPHDSLWYRGPPPSKFFSSADPPRHNSL